MNKFKLLLFSASPFAIGYMINYAILNFNWYGKGISLISILFAAYWFFVGYKSYDYVKSTKESILLGNSFAIISIILLLFQRIFLQRYSFGILGFAPQMFYLPMLRLSTWMQRVFLFFIRTTSGTTIFTISFILMMLIYYIGYNKNLKKHK